MVTRARESIKIAYCSSGIHCIANSVCLHRCGLDFGQVFLLGMGAL